MPMIGICQGEYRMEILIISNIGNKWYGEVILFLTEWKGVGHLVRKFQSYKINMCFCYNHAYANLASYAWVWIWKECKKDSLIIGNVMQAQFTLLYI